MVTRMRFSGNGIWDIWKNIYHSKMDLMNMPALFAPMICGLWTMMGIHSSGKNGATTQPCPFGKGMNPPSKLKIYRTKDQLQLELRTEPLILLSKIKTIRFSFMCPIPCRINPLPSLKNLQEKVNWGFMAM